MLHNLIVKGQVIGDIVDRLNYIKCRLDTPLIVFVRNINQMSRGQSERERERERERVNKTQRRYGRN